MATPSTGAPNAGDPGTIRVKVRTMEPATYELTVRPQMTVLQLKEELRSHTTVQDVRRMRVIYAGRPLADTATLHESGVTDNDTMHLVIRPVDAPPPSGPADAGQQAANAQPGDPNGLNRFFQGVLQSLTGLPVTMGPTPAGGAPGGAAGTGSGAAAGGAASQGAGAAGGAAGSVQAGGMGGTLPMGFGPAQINITTGSMPMPGAIQVPHMLTALTAYMQRLQSPDFNPGPVPLSSLLPSVGGALDERLNTLTEALQTLLHGAYLPTQLQSLLEESMRDPVGQVPDTTDASAGGGTASNTRTAAESGGALRGSRAAGRDAAGNAAAAAAHNNNNRINYRYTPLAVAALAELLRRADTHLAASLLPRLRDMSTTLLVSAAVNESRQSQQATLRALASQLHGSAAMLVELARATVAVQMAVRGNLLPLLNNTAAAIQPDGSGPALPRLQPRTLPAGLGGDDPFMAPLDGMSMLGLSGLGGLGGINLGMGSPSPVPGSTGVEGGAGAAAGAAGGMPGMGFGGANQVTVELGDVGDLSQLGPMIQSMLSGITGGAGMGAPGAAAATAGAQPGAGTRRGGAAAGGATTATRAGTAGTVPRSASAAAGGAREDEEDGEGTSVQHMLPFLRQMVGSISANIARTVVGRLSHMLRTVPGAMANPDGVSQFAGSLVQQILGEQLGNTFEMLSVHSDAVEDALRGLEDNATPEQMLSSMVGMVNDIMSGNPPRAPPRAQRPATVVRAGAAPTAVTNPMATSSTGTPAAASSTPAATTPSGTPAAAATVPAASGALEAAQQAAADATSAARSAAAAAAAAGAAAAARAASATTQPLTTTDTTSPPTAPAAASPSSAHAVSPAAPAAAESAAPRTSPEPTAPAAANSAADAAGPSAPPAPAGPRGLGLGLKPHVIVRRKPAAPAAPAAPDTAASAPPSSEGGDSTAAPRSAPPVPRAAPSGPGAPPDMSGLMSMMSRMMSGGGGGPGGGGGAGAPPALGGIMQMATQIASDPAMGPMIDSAMSSLMGGSGAGAGGGLGGLLGSLMGGMPAARGGNRSRVTNAPISEEVISENLGPEDAARWRQVIARDAERQRVDVRAAPLNVSDAYDALTPSSGRPSLLHLIPGDKGSASK